MLTSILSCFFWLLLNLNHKISLIFLLFLPCPLVYHRLYHKLLSVFQVCDSSARLPGVSYHNMNTPPNMQTFQHSKFMGLVTRTTTVIYQGNETRCFVMISEICMYHVSYILKICLRIMLQERLYNCQRGIICINGPSPIRLFWRWRMWKPPRPWFSTISLLLL